MLLDKELKIKNVTLQNRIVMPPMATEKSDQGIVTQDQIDYYVKRAQNTGLVIVEHAYISPEGK
ncbi:MAG: NADH:flavin oxidoreductase, partial [Methanosphaera sp.]|nr:NADH:flavin oxidoreductase [Methanosphaera sp.]